MIGGVIRWIADRKSGNLSDDASSGILFCSGMIAGEGLVGILLAILAVIGISENLDLSGSINTGLVGGIALMAAMIAAVAAYAIPRKGKK